MKSIPLIAHLLRDNKRVAPISLFVYLRHHKYLKLSFVKPSPFINLQSKTFSPIIISFIFCPEHKQLNCKRMCLSIVTVSQLIKEMLLHVIINVVSIIMHYSVSFLEIKSVLSLSFCYEKRTCFDRLSNAYYMNTDRVST